MYALTTFNVDKKPSIANFFLKKLFKDAISPKSVYGGFAVSFLIHLLSFFIYFFYTYLYIFDLIFATVFFL